MPESTLTLQEGSLESSTQVNDSSHLLDAMEPDYIGYWHSGDARYMFAPPKTLWREVQCEGTCP